MNTLTSTLVGTSVPLPHLGAAVRGVVVGQSWSEALGQILRVREDSRVSSGATLLIYGDLLVALLAELSVGN